ncbi:MAG: winged helix-turn-helix transcriptional regulator [Deltaproteobacteria bacterium]|nr:winged helix-turn-helix transcriptional regulator [Deltaproteobacteria bacterium]
MNGKDGYNDDYRSFLLLDEISRNEELTQRDLSKKFGLALGLINSYLKNLASKGYITVSAIPRNRYKYYLTPHGFAEKTRLTYQHLQNFTNLYRVARHDYQELLNGLKRSKVRRVVFCGVDEVTEIAYLSLKEAGLDLVGIVDDEAAGRKSFFGMDVRSLGDASIIKCDIIIVTSFNSGERLRDGLVAAGVRRNKICGINMEGWLKRLEGDVHGES